MGSGSSTHHASEAQIRSQTKTNCEIDEFLKQSAKIEKEIMKLLLLGAGECGKSTILKQMRILHDNGFTTEEVNAQIKVVRGNLIQSILAIVHAMKKLGIKLKKQSLEEDERLLVQTALATGTICQIEKISPDLCDAIRRLWLDDGVQQCFERSNEYQLNDSAKYFLDSTSRICSPEFIPTQQDILRARVQTTGIVEVEFVVKKNKFRVFDVGGQRSERRKWLHCFDNVTAIIFITAISEYDQAMREDAKMNRMLDSINLFEAICNSQYFVKSHMILFLNKTDLFEEKLKKRPISILFHEYRGPPNDYQASTEFLQRKFVKLNKVPGKDVYCHFTCATDTDQVEQVLDSTTDMIVTGNLKECGVY